MLPICHTRFRFPWYVAYILVEPNVIGRDEVIDAKTLPRVQMPNWNGFIAEDPRPDVRVGR